MTFRVGMKVVCVDPVDDLVKDRIYTVTNAGAGYQGIPMIDIDGSKFCRGGLFLAFYARRFRPLVERKTSIEIFQRMLAPSRQKESAR